MNTTTIHRHYIANLYGNTMTGYCNTNGSPISRSTFYTQYLGDLQITPHKDEVNHAYITAEEKDLLDQYHHNRLQGKAVLEEFMNQLSLPESIPDVDDFSQIKATRQALSLPPAIEIVVEAIAHRLSPQSNPLEPQERLQQIADRGWTVTTEQLTTILGVYPKEGDRLGFTLQRVGKVGRQRAWKVWKTTD